MKNERDTSPEKQVLATTPKDRRASETHGQSPRPVGVHIGPDSTIGPSEVPANATLPPAEAVIPGKGRVPR